MRLIGDVARRKRWGVGTTNLRPSLLVLPTLRGSYPLSISFSSISSSQKTDLLPPYLHDIIRDWGRLERDDYSPAATGGPMSTVATRTGSSLGDSRRFFFFFSANLFALGQYT